jgi:hypothetical protein
MLVADSQGSHPTPQLGPRRRPVAAGSINWQVLLDDKQTTISLRNLADKFFDALGWHEDMETAVQPLGSRNQRNIRMTLKHSLFLATLMLRLLCLAACPT